MLAHKCRKLFHVKQFTPKLRLNINKTHDFVMALHKKIPYANSDCGKNVSRETFLHKKKMFHVEHLNNLLIICLRRYKFCPNRLCCNSL